MYSQRVEKYYYAAHKLINYLEVKMLLKNLTFILTSLLLVACSATTTIQPMQALLIPKHFELALKDNTPGTQIPIGKIDLEYVELSGSEHIYAEDKINKAIRQMVGMNEAYSGNTDVTVKTKSANLNARYMHLSMESYEYVHGAANGKNTIQSVYFDLQSGEQLSFYQVFKAGSETVINQAIQQWLNQQGIEHEFKTVDANSCFYQQGNQFIFCFSQYDIAAGVLGNIFVPIEKAALQDYLLILDLP